MVSDLDSGTDALQKACREWSNITDEVSKSLQDLAKAVGEYSAEPQPPKRRSIGKFKGFDAYGKAIIDYEM